MPARTFRWPALVIALLAPELARAQGNVLVSWDCEDHANVDKVFDSVADWGGGKPANVSGIAHSGSYSVRFAFLGGSEAVGGGLRLTGLGGTRTLFFRRYLFLQGTSNLHWEGAWPGLLPVTRYLTSTGYWDGYGIYPFVHENFVESRDQSECAQTTAARLRMDVSPMDVVSDVTLPGAWGPDGGLPSLRESTWYKVESWLELNSRLDAADGVFQLWVDDQALIDRHDVVYQSSARPSDAGFNEIVVGGKTTASDCSSGDNSDHRYVYMDDFYLSTTLDRDGGPPPADGGTDAGADGAVDSGPDGGEDAGQDAAVDAGLDAGEDAGADAGGEAIVGHYCACGVADPAPLFALAALLGLGVARKRRGGARRVSS